MRWRQDQRECTCYVGAVRSGVDTSSHETVRNNVLRALLAFASELISCQTQVPSPAQSAKNGWQTPRLVKVPSVDQLAICIAACSVSALNNSAEPQQLV